jgi:hypothetical protein
MMASISPAGGGYRRKGSPIVSKIRSFRAVAMFGALTFAVLSLDCEPVSASVTASELFTWPASLVPMGNGYPKEGDACRRLGESPATANYLDHTATLVGCPGGADSASVRAILIDHRAHVVGKADGVTLISISNGFRRRK